MIFIIIFEMSRGKKLNCWILFSVFGITSYTKLSKDVKRLLGNIIIVNMMFHL